MKLAERDFRLNQVRAEKRKIEQELQEIEDEAKKKMEEDEVKNQRTKLVMEKRRQYRNNRTFFQTILDGFTGRSYPNKEEYKDENGGIVGLGGSLAEMFVVAQFMIPHVKDLEKKLKELNEEEAKLLGVKIDDEPKLNEQESRRNEIFQKRAQRLQEKDTRIREETRGKSRDEWTDEETERVRRLENAYNQADARDIDELSRIL